MIPKVPGAAQMFDLALVATFLHRTQLIHHQKLEPLTTHSCASCIPTHPVSMPCPNAVPLPVVALICSLYTTLALIDSLKLTHGPRYRLHAQ